MITVKKLREILADKPELMFVFVEQIDHTYGTAPAQKAELREIVFRDGKLMAVDTVLVITDEH